MLSSWHSHKPYYGMVASSQKCKVNLTRSGGQKDIFAAVEHFPTPLVVIRCHDEHYVPNTVLGLEVGHGSDKVLYGGKVAHVPSQVILVVGAPNMYANKNLHVL